ncbi:hypothetical protein ACQ5ES_04240 [Pseudidiomarina sp. E22-M8]|uniref:hypothetical protein n=1 Tax=Pseudidiomarina sp. E22-M8 TaxID=3424768 RepID=UPI00403D2C1B
MLVTQTAQSNQLTSFHWLEDLSHQQAGYAVATGAACRAGDRPVQLWLPEGRAAPVLETLEQWSQHPLAEFLNCFSVRWYQDAEDLKCQAIGNRGSQQCDLALLPRELQQHQLVFVTAEALSIASATHWQMVMPTSASVDLLAHEAGHWLGFADEYAMSTTLAVDYCNGRYQHPSVNVVTTTTNHVTSAELQALWQRLPWRDAVKDWRELAQQDGKGVWRLGSDNSVKVGLFASNTCAAVANVYSWKPVARMTAMEYHDVNVWPPIYLELLRTLE